MGIDQHGIDDQTVQGDAVFEQGVTIGNERRTSWPSGGGASSPTDPNADVTFIEDFEGSDPMANYSVDGSGGWSVQDVEAFDGDQAAVLGRNITNSDIYRTDPPETIEPGNVYEFRFNVGDLSGDPSPAIFFNVSGPDSNGDRTSYRIHVGNNGTRVYMFGYDPSFNSLQDNGLDKSITSGEWCGLRLDLSNWPQIRFRVLDSDGTDIGGGSHDSSGDSVPQVSNPTYGFGNDSSGEPLYVDSLVENPDQSGYVPGASTGETVTASVDGEDINPRSIGTGDLYITEFPGNDLGERVNAALEYMDSAGYDATIRIPDKGTPWTWSTPVTHRVDNRRSQIGATTDRLGIDIQAGSNAKIKYDGSDFMLTIKKAFGKVNIEGGWWTCSGDAKGWLRLKDVSRGFFHPLFVDFRTSNSTDHSNDSDEPRDVTGAVCVSMENHGGWCELNTFEGWFKGDNGLDTRHGDQTAGSGGTESFQSTSIRDSYFHTHEAGGFGFRLRGNHQYCSYRGLRFHINAENGRGLVIDSSTTWPYKAPFHDCKFENNDYSSGEIAIYATENYDAYYPVSFDNMHVSSSIATKYEHAGGDGRAVHVHASTDGQWSVGGLAPGSSKLRFKAEEGKLWITDSDGNTTWSA